MNNLLLSTYKQNILVTSFDLGPYRTKNILRAGFKK